MQKDIHFYLTYLLAEKAGLRREDAEQIAWADQYTDESNRICTRPKHSPLSWVTGTRDRFSCRC